MLYYPKTEQPTIQLEVGDILEYMLGFYMVVVVGYQQYTIILLSDPSAGWWWYNPMLLEDLQVKIENDSANFVYHGKNIKMVATHV